MFKDLCTENWGNLPRKILRQQKNRNFSILNSGAPSQNNKTSRTSCRRLFKNFLPFTPTEITFEISLNLARSWKICILEKQATEVILVGWFMSVNQKSGRQTYCRRFVSGSLFVSPCPQECNFQSETKIEPDLWLWNNWFCNKIKYETKINYSLNCKFLSREKRHPHPMLSASGHV